LTYLGEKLTLTGPVPIEPPRGKLGVLLPGLGAVATTFIAGVYAIRRGTSKPIGSLTQMGTIRLGKRTEKRVPTIKDFVELTALDDLVFGGWDIFGWLGYPMQIKIDFLCRDSILAAPIVLDLALFLDLAQRSGMRGIQEWLSFYFKSPLCAPELYPEHDLFIQLMKLKNTLRYLKGEDLITHLGLEYYD
jgi:myo-inositol-1-phosphate synthase